MRVNGQQVVFNVLNALKYPEEEVADCSMISSWEGIIHKNLLKTSDVLEQELGKLEKPWPQEGIIYGPMEKSEEESVEVIESTAVECKQNLPSIEEPPELELKPLPEHL